MSRSISRSSTTWRARKTLPCQRNHFSRSSSLATSVASSEAAALPRPLAIWPMTVNRIVMWNQSIRCSALGIQVEGKLAHVLTAVGQEGDLLIRLHPRRLERLEETALRFGVVGLDEAEAPGRALGRHALAGDHLEPALAPGALAASVHIAAIEA